MLGSRHGTGDGFVLIIAATFIITLATVAYCADDKQNAVVLEDDFSAEVLSDKWRITSGTHPVKDGVVAIYGELQWKLKIEADNWILEFRAKFTSAKDGSNWQALDIINEDGDYIRIYKQGGFVLRYNVGQKSNYAIVDRGDSEWHAFKMIKSQDRLALYIDDNQTPAAALDNVIFPSKHWVALKPLFACGPESPIYLDWIKLRVPH